MIYFKRTEFSCKCGCGYDTVDYELGQVLDDIRQYFAQAVVVNSGCRCQAHNRAIGGKINSQHLYGRAADIVVRQVAPEQVQKYVLNTYPDKLGVGCYNTFTHIDTRNWKARW